MSPDHKCAAADDQARYDIMRDPEPRPAETARQEGAQGRVKNVDTTIPDGEVDASDPAVRDAADVADEVGANA